ncbi:unnamed protein product [Rhodiola kirilowii]
MADGDKRIKIDDEVDRIGELPVHLREHILECLSIKDAVATSVLSSKWRYCWTGLRKLKFNRDFWNFDEHLVMLDPLEHARAVDRVLMLHCGPIREFTLYVPGIEHISVDINMWLRVLSNNGVQKIEIDAVEYELDDDYFHVPSCLFHCRALEKLRLRFCKLTLPTDFKGFANLTSLILYHVDITPSLLESLISGCLLLETLSLEYLMPQNPFTLEALNLKTFYFIDLQLEFIIFKNIPKLTCVSLLAMDQTERIDTPQPYSTLQRLCSLSMVKELTYDFFLLELHWEHGDRFKINKAAAKLLKSEAQKHTSYDSIQTLKITGMGGSPSEVLLIKLLQTRCRKVPSIITEGWPWKIELLK